MTWTLAILYFQAAVAVLYVGRQLLKFGMTDTISATYYENPEGKVEGFWRLAFRFFCVVLGAGVFQWIDPDHWGSFLIFFGGSLIFFVGLAPDYKTSKLSNGVHVWSAILGIVFSLAGQWVVYGIWLPTVIVGLTFIIVHGFKVRGATWYVEAAAIIQILTGYIKHTYQ
jgi:hypothetical protein